MYRPGHLQLASVSALAVEDKQAVVAALARDGSVIIQQTDVDTAVSCPEALSRIGSLFGTPISHRLSDRFGVHPIRNIPDYPEYANTTNAELNLHTDGAFEPCPPKVMLIYCERPSEVGGHTRLCSGKALHEHLKRHHPADLAALFREDAYFIRRDDKQGTKAVFRLADGRIQMAYRYGADIVVEINPLAQPGFAAIESFLAKPENHFEFKLARHQILIFDNTRVLHGRTAFPAAAPRSLYGLWCDGSGPDCRDLRFGFEPS